MSQYRLRVAVTLKPEVLDPAGQATKKVVAERGYPGVISLRIGKLVDLVVDASSVDAAMGLAQTLGQDFLANPVLERFEVWVINDED